MNSQQKEALDLQMRMQRELDGLKRLAFEEQEKLKADVERANLLQQKAPKENDDLRSFIDRASQDTAKPQCLFLLTVHEC